MNHFDTRSMNCTFHAKFGVFMLEDTFMNRLSVYKKPIFVSVTNFAESAITPLDILLGQDPIGFTLLKGPTALNT